MRLGLMTGNVVNALYCLPLNTSMTAYLCPFPSHMLTTMNAQAIMPRLPPACAGPHDSTRKDNVYLFLKFNLLIRSSSLRDFRSRAVKDPSVYIKGLVWGSES
jgi:hypothetical protein